MRSYNVALLLFLSLLVAAGAAQVTPAPPPPANLGFDEGEAGGTPLGWHTVTGWTIAEVRRGVGCRNGGCLTFTRPDPPPANSFGNVMQSLSAKPYAGKHFIYRAAVRVEAGGPADTAMLWFRVDLPNQGIGFFDNMRDRPIRSGDWAVYEIKGDVDPDATRINFGIMAHGKARVWVDDVSLEVVTPQPVGPETAAAREAIAKQYLRIDEAQNAGRFEEILTVALPDARGGSFVMKMPLREYMETAKRVMSASGAKASTKTEITEVTLAAEATVRTRSQGTITAAGTTRAMRGTSQDVWVRQADGKWLLKETTIVSQGEVLAPLGPETIKQVASAIAAQAVPLTSVRAGAPREDLAAFGKAVGDARIVSLGEATHGSREIFQMKHRLLEYLVKEKGFTVFAIEANWPESQAADRYVKTGEGNPRQALKDMYFWTWQTEEVLAMVEWIRAFNQAPGDHPVLTFTSFDMQTYDVAAERVIAFVRKHAREDLAAAVESAYQSLKALPRNARQDPAFQAASEQAEKVTALLESRREVLVREAGANSFRDALQMTRIVAQATRLRTPSASSSYRDEMMAKNIEWLANEVHRGEKIVVWAHNGHVSTSSNSTYQFKPMGNWLRQQFGREMYVAGFAIHTGSVRAIGGGVRRTGLTSHAIPAAPAGSGSAVLSAAGKPIFFLDFAAARSGAALLGEWLNSRHSFRECGAIWNLEDTAEGNMMTATPAESYDGLIFLEKTEAAKGLD
jgi:erythromycin esterase